MNTLDSRRREMLDELKARGGPTNIRDVMLVLMMPVIELGGAGVHIPYHITWAAEHAAQPVACAGRPDAPQISRPHAGGVRMIVGVSGDVRAAVD